MFVVAASRSGQSADQPVSSTSKAQKPGKVSDDVESEMVRRNGEIFVDWPEPKVALVFTGSLDGYVEPCGCSGKENQKGGLSRRDMMLKQLKGEKKWQVVALDVGGLVNRFGRQAEMKYAATVDALKSMGYQAVGFGPDDLRLSAAELYAILSPVEGQETPFVSANMGLYSMDDKTVPRFRVFEVGGKKIGVTSVVGDDYRRKVNNNDIQFKPAAEALAEVVPELEKAKCDVLVLLSNAKLDASTALAKKFPQFTYVLSAGGADEPPDHPMLVEGTRTRLIEVGHKGQYAIVIGLFDDAKQPARYQRVPLDARWGESERMKQVMASYQDQLKEIGLSGLGLKPVKHPSGREFIGSKECGDCHTKAYAIWEKTPHAKALETLVHLDPPRQYDPECLSCHVTGWEPQKYFPYAGGYRSIDKTPLLAGNGCENCHGPGSAHAAAERGELKASDTDLAHYRDEMRLSIKTEAGKRRVIDDCLQCHDGDNSIEFEGGKNFDKYWPKVAHNGKD